VKCQIPPNCKCLVVVKQSGMMCADDIICDSSDSTRVFDVLFAFSSQGKGLATEIDFVQVYAFSRIEILFSR
jgi:hypothetical protein